jgi:hypothetical protein
MADSRKHLDQWQHNRAFLGLIPTDYPDWMVTVSFYVALHAIDALLAHDGVGRVNSHESRNDVLIKTKRYQQIWKHYQPLHDLSRRIRYLAAPGDWVPVSEIPKQIWNRYLLPIEKSAGGLKPLEAPQLTLKLPAADGN